MDNIDRLWIIKRELCYQFYISENEHLKMIDTQINCLLAENYKTERERIETAFNDTIFKDEIILKIVKKINDTKDSKEKDVYKDIFSSLISKRLIIVRNFYERQIGSGNIIPF